MSIANRNQGGGVELALTAARHSELWQEAAVVESSVFMGSDYVDSPQELWDEYAPYAPSSQMIAASHAGKVVGFSRLISYNDGIGLKTINDAEQGKLDLSDEGHKALEAMDLSTTLEVGTLGVEPEYRKPAWRALFGGKPMVMNLYAGIYAVSMMEQKPNIIASFDLLYFRGFRSKFGDKVHALGTAKDYMGSKTIVAAMNVDELAVHFKENGEQEFVDKLVVLGKHMRSEDELVDEASQQTA